MVSAVIHRNNLESEDKSERQRKAAHDGSHGIPCGGNENVYESHGCHERQVPNNQPLKDLFGDSSPLQALDLLNRFPDSEKQESQVIKTVQAIRATNGGMAKSGLSQ